MTAQHKDRLFSIKGQAKEEYTTHYSTVKTLTLAIWPRMNPRNRCISKKQQANREGIQSEMTFMLTARMYVYELTLHVTPMGAFQRFKQARDSI
jgi:hypothetical protein